VVLSISRVRPLYAASAATDAPFTCSLVHVLHRFQRVGVYDLDILRREARKVREPLAHPAHQRGTRALPGGERRARGLERLGKSHRLRAFFGRQVDVP
jgi:hypothetical protein